MLRTYEDLDEVKCPACNKTQFKSRKSFGSHCSRCPEWNAKIRVTSKDYNFDAYLKIGRYSPQAEEGIDYVYCRICEENGISVRKRIINHHVKSEHGLSKDQYLSLYPDAPTNCSGIQKKRVATVRDKYGVDNVFQAEEIKDKFDVTETAWSPEAREKRSKTNFDKYGHENPLGGKEGSERAQKGMLANHGVRNPQQDPEIRKRTLKTTEKRYGDKYFFRTEEFREKFIQACQEKWGTDHHMQNEEFYELFRQNFESTHGEGIDSPMKIEGAWERLVEGFVEKFGVEHPLQLPKFIEKRRKTCDDKYGYYNVSKSPKIKEKIRTIWIENYGVPFPPQSQNIALPTSIEIKIDEATSDHVLYTGEFTYWIDGKNPDFVVLDEADLLRYREGAEVQDLNPYAVVEAFGDHWHSKKFTGQEGYAHQKEREEFFQSRGFDCLTLWGSEIRKLDHNEIKEQIDALAKIA